MSGYFYKFKTSKKSSWHDNLEDGWDNGLGGNAWDAGWEAGSGRQLGMTARVDGLGETARRDSWGDGSGGRLGETARGDGCEDGSGGRLGQTAWGVAGRCKHYKNEHSINKNLCNIKKSTELLG